MQMGTTDTIIIIYVTIIGIILGLLLIANLFRLEKYTTGPLSNLMRPFILSMNNKKGIMYGIKIPIVLGLLGLLFFLAISPDYKAQKYDEKKAYIVENLYNIRDLQVLYKSQSDDNKYCENFQDLILFAKHDSVEITKKVERVEIIINPAWIANGWKKSDIEKEPKYYTTPTGERKVNEEGGWLKKTSIEKVLINKKKVCCSENDSLQISNLENIQEALPTNLLGKQVKINSDIIKSMNIDNLAKVPTEIDSKFTLSVDWIEKTKTGTFEVTYNNPSTGKILKIGDLQTGSTDGNWE